MATQVYTRGNTVLWNTTFYNLSGILTNPTAANLFITFPVNGVETTVEVPMTQNVNLWSATWESSASDPGDVDWSIRTTGGSPTVAEDGTFRLSANAANP